VLRFFFFFFVFSCWARNLLCFFFAHKYLIIGLCYSDCFNGYCFFRICLTLRSNVFLSCDCYNKIFVINTLYWKSFSNLIVGGVFSWKSYFNSFFCFTLFSSFCYSSISFFHKVFLHETGSKSGLSNLPKGDKLKFHPFYSWKDIFGFLVFFYIFLLFGFSFYELFFDCENFIEAKSLVTPVHIQPEWYFLAAYAILRSIPKKLGGVIALFLSVSIYIILPFISKKIHEYFFHLLLFN